MEFKKLFLIVGIVLLICFLPLILIINPTMEFYQRLVDDNPNGSIAPWTQMKVADIYYYTGRPEKSEEAYYKYYTNYEDDPRRAEALYYWACSIDDQLARKKARAAFERFIDEFPDSPLAEDAKKRIDQLKLSNY